MASNDEYQHYNFSQELVNIDETVNALEEQLNKVMDEVKKMAEMGDALKKHQSAYKTIWKKHNLDKFNNILSNAKKLDTIVYQNF